MHNIRQAITKTIKKLQSHQNNQSSEKHSPSIGSPRNNNYKDQDSDFHDSPFSMRKNLHVVKIPEILKTLPDDELFQEDSMHSIKSINISENEHGIDQESDESEQSVGYLDADSSSMNHRNHGVSVQNPRSRVQSPRRRLRDEEDQMTDRAPLRAETEEAEEHGGSSMRQRNLKAIRNHIRANKAKKGPDQIKEVKKDVNIGLNRKRSQKVSKKRGILGKKKIPKIDQKIENELFKERRKSSLKEIQEGIIIKVNNKQVIPDPNSNLPSQRTSPGTLNLQRIQLKNLKPNPKSSHNIKKLNPNFIKHPKGRPNSPAQNQRIDLKGVDISLKEPSISSISTPQKQFCESVVASPFHLEKLQQARQERLKQILRRVFAILISKTTRRVYSSISWFPQGYLFGELNAFLRISVYRFWVFYIALMLSSLSNFISVSSYNGKSYDIRLKIFYSLLGISHTLAVSFEFYLSRQYSAFHPLEVVILGFDYFKFFVMLISTISEAWSIMALAAIIAMFSKVILRLYIEDRRAFLSYFCDEYSMGFDFAIVILTIKFYGYLSWGFLISAVGVMVVAGLIVYIFILLRTGVFEVGDLDFIILFSVLSIGILLVIISGTLDVFERELKFRTVLVFCFSLIFMIKIGLGVYLYTVRKLKPRYLKIELRKQMIEPDLKSLLRSPVRNQQQSEQEQQQGVRRPLEFPNATENDQQKKVTFADKAKDVKLRTLRNDNRHYIKLFKEKKRLTIIYPENFKLEKSAQCFNCRCQVESKVYHVPFPCLHGMYCVNCAVKLLSSVRYCLICNRKVTHLERVWADFENNKLVILKPIFYVKAEKFRLPF